MSHTIYAAKFEQTIIHQHLWWESQSHAPAHMLMRLYPIDKLLVSLQSEKRGLLSSNLFSVIKNFDVLDYDPLFSDVHCALQFSCSVDIFNREHNCSQPVKWDNSKKEEFVEYLTVNKNNEITNIENRLGDMILLKDVSNNVVMM